MDSDKVSLSRSGEKPVADVWAAIEAVGASLVQLAQAARGGAVSGASGGVASGLSLTVPNYSPLPPGSVGVVELINDFLLTKARAGRSDRYLRALRNSLLKFSHGRARQAASAVTAADLQRWLDSRQWSARTRKGYLSDVSTLYAWGMRRGLVAHNPALAVEVPTPRVSGVSLHSPAQVATVLEYARKEDIAVCRLLAIRYFAGVRSAEAHRLTEADIRPGFVEVPAAKAKTRARRLVTIQPALAAWLGIGGALPVLDFERVRRITAGAGVPWPHNVTRHSFCSYHLQAFGSAAKTALEAGHSETQLFAHYRERCTPEAAAEFWNLRPK